MGNVAFLEIKGNNRGGSYRTEISQFICIPYQLPGFCIVRVSAEENSE